jgi:hypothetical protein
LKNVCPERQPIEKLKLKLPTKSHIVIRLLEPLLIANYSRLLFRQAPLPPNPLLSAGDKFKSCSKQKSDCLH